MKALLSALILALTFSATALAHGDHAHDGVTVEKAWARKTSRTVSAAVYLTIRNDGEAVEELLDADTDIAGTVMIHRSFEEDGIMKMDHVMGVPLKPGETFEFTPGGYHIMLMGLNAPLEQGTVFPLTLTFKHAGEVQVIVEVTGMMGME